MPARGFKAPGGLVYRISELAGLATKRERDPDLNPFLTAQKRGLPGQFRNCVDLTPDLKLSPDPRVGGSRAWSASSRTDRSHLAVPGPRLRGVRAQQDERPR